MLVVQMEQMKVEDLSETKETINKTSFKSFKANRIEMMEDSYNQCRIPI